MSEATKPPAQIRVGDVLNGIFEVKRFIARGGMGEVFEGVNIQTEEKVAIKVILPALAADPKVEAMFRKEAKTLTKLSHPALVQYRVLAHDPNLGLLYIVTDFIDGTSLNEAMAGLGATPSELLALTRRLAEGLRSAHELGAIHRDLSPDNVLLERGRLERARIIDFGIAKDLDPGNATIIGDGFAGKLGFVAPEQLGDFGRNIGPWTDVYSLGLVILSVVRGKNVDLGQTLVDAIDKRRAVMDLSLVPTELRPLLQAMLVADPAARLPSMGDVIQVIDRNNYQRTLFALPTTDFTPGASPAMPAGNVGALPTPAAPPAAAPPPPPPPPPPQAAYIAPAAPKVARAAVGGGGSSKLPLILGGGVAALAILGGGAWYFMGSGGGKSGGLAGAQEAVKAAQCSWVNVKQDPNSPNVLVLEGASIGAAGVKSTVAGAVGSDITLDSDKLGPLKQQACSLVDSVRAIRSGKTLLSGSQAEYELRVDGSIGFPGKLGIRTEQTLDIGATDKDFAVYGIDPDGTASFMMNRASVPEMVKNGRVAVLDNDRYRLNIDTNSVGRIGILVIVGNPIIDNQWSKSPAYSRDDGWKQRFDEASKKGGWTSDMIWFNVEDSTPG